MVIIFGRPLSSLAKPLIGSAKSQKYLNVFFCTSSSKSSNVITSIISSGTNPISAGGGSILLGLSQEIIPTIIKIVTTLKCIV